MSAPAPVPGPGAVPAGSIVARFDYDASADDEVSVRVGEIGQVVNKPSDDWWLVKFGSKNGLVPSNYVSEVLSEAVAEFDYSAQDETEVNFAENDTILVLEKLDADWWVGQVNNMQGMFPSAYVKEVPLKKAQPHKKQPSGVPPLPQVPPTAANPAVAAATATPSPAANPTPALPTPKMASAQPKAMEADEPIPVASSKANAQTIQSQPAGNPQALLGLAKMAQSAQSVVLKKTNTNKDKEKEKKEEKVVAPQIVAAPAAIAEPVGRQSMAEKLTNMKIERMEMLSKEVQMVSELEKELNAIKEQLKGKEQQLAAVQAKSDREYKEFTTKLEISESQRADLQRRNGDLELEVGKLSRDIAALKANDESGKVKELQETVRTQFEDLKKLQKLADEKDNILRETVANHDKIARSLNDNLDDLQAKLVESEHRVRALESQTTKLDGIVAFGELCLQINGTTVMFKVSQASSVSGAITMTMPETPKEHAPHEPQWAEETKEEWVAKPEPVSASPVSETPVQKGLSTPKVSGTATTPVPDSHLTAVKPPVSAAAAVAAVKPKFPPKVTGTPAAKPASHPDGTAAPKTIARKASYADKLKKSLETVESSSGPPASADGKACDSCAVGECVKFTPNQFKPHLCQTCRHNKNVHHLF